MRGSKARYRFEYLGSGEYAFYEDGQLVFTFRRSNFREKFESLGRSSNWVGSMLRLLDKAYPYLSTFSFRKSSLEDYPEDFWVAYLRSKGFLVWEPLPFSDVAVIWFLRSKGYRVSCPWRDDYKYGGVGDVD